MIDTTKEYIICAANFYKDKKNDKYNDHLPKNIGHGLITCGQRHHNCINTFALIVGFPYTKAALIIKNTEIQGFLTSYNRFVGRKSAMRIARKCGQVPLSQSFEELYSEDIY